MRTKRLTLDALLTAVALTIYVVELQLPHVVPIPGVKLGLANIVTVVAMVLLGPADAAGILFSRIVLGSLFSGNMMAVLYSVSGGLACFVTMLPLKKLLTPRQIWVMSVLGAAAHNLGQMAAAVLVTGTPALIVYLPVLMVSGIAAGLFTGAAAQFAALRLKKVLDKYHG